jgi:hypothetical protein
MRPTRGRFIAGRLQPGSLYSAKHGLRGRDFFLPLAREWRRSNSNPRESPACRRSVVPVGQPQARWNMGRTSPDTIAIRFPACRKDQTRWVASGLRDVFRAIHLLHTKRCHLTIRKSRQYFQLVLRIPILPL